MPWSHLVRELKRLRKVHADVREPSWTQNSDWACHRFRNHICIVISGSCHGLLSTSRLFVFAMIYLLMTSYELSECFHIIPTMLYGALVDRVRNECLRGRGTVMERLREQCMLSGIV